MYRVKTKTITKTAGTIVPEDKKAWPSEVLKSLASQHPYIDTSQISIKFERMDPEEKTAFGKVLLANKVVLPFSIRPNEKTKKLELDPIDIMYDGKSMQAVTEASIRSAIDQGGNRLVKEDDVVPPNNEYIGDQTGDVTPLEWSNYPGGFAGPRTAGAGLTSYVLQNEADVDKLFNMLSTYSGINSAFEALGLTDSLESLRYGLVESTEHPRLAYITKRPGGFKVTFNGVDERHISAKDLSAFLGSEFQSVARDVLRKGWAMVRDFPTRVTSEPLSLVPQPVRYGGKYVVKDADKENRCCYVFSELINFDGSRKAEQKAICPGTLEYAIGKKFRGIRTGGFEWEDLPTCCIEPGVKGFFVDQSWGSLKATPNVIVEQAISMPDMPIVYICSMEYTGAKVGIILVDALVRPQEVPKFRSSKYDIIPDQCYYVPTHMQFVKCGEHIQLDDHAERAIVATTVQKNARRYYIDGHTVSGMRVLEKNLDADQMRFKLAMLGVDDDMLEKIASIPDRSSMKLHNLDSVEIEKTAQVSSKFHEVKVAAEEALKAVDESDDINTDPEILDAVISLQFVSEENMRDLLGAEQLFIECEDKLARLLLASRQGERSIHEKGVQRALKGMGAARESLKRLAIELDERERA